MKNLARTLRSVQSLVVKSEVLVDECSKQLKKKINFYHDGPSYYLPDKTYKALSLAVLHGIRNASDHGVESPTERKNIGKKEEGAIQLQWQFERGVFIFKISDDGRGIDPKKVIQTAQQKRLLVDKKVEQMTLSQILELIFLPGFSTQTEPSLWSGRGVGLEAVKSAVQTLMGKISIKSTSQTGTQLVIELPIQEIGIQCEIDSNLPCIAYPTNNANAKLYHFRELSSHPQKEIFPAELSTLQKEIGQPLFVAVCGNEVSQQHAFQIFMKMEEVGTLKNLIHSKNDFYLIPFGLKLKR